MGSAIHWVRWRRREAKGLRTNKARQDKAWDVERDSDDSDDEVEVYLDESSVAIVTGALSKAFQNCDEDIPVADLCDPHDKAKAELAQAVDEACAEDPAVEAKVRAAIAGACVGGSSRAAEATES